MPPSPPRSAAPAAKSPGPGRPKDAAKRTAILEAAKRLFPRHGFERVSMEAIAAEAGVSKLTVYNHFGDKETLFVEAVKARCRVDVPDDAFALPVRDVRGALTAIAERFYALVSSEEAMSIKNLLAAGGPDHAALRALFWNAGPARIAEGMRGFLDRAVAAGRLDIHDTTVAARQFLCVLDGPVDIRQFAPESVPASPADDAAHIRASVDFFLRAYAART